MARTALTKYNALGAFPSLPLSATAADLTMAAADTVNKNQCVATGNDLIIVWNSGVSPYTVTVTSAPTPHTKRSGDITAYSVAAGVISVLGPFIKDGWMQTDGNLYFEANNAAVKFAVVALS
ncbi:MAG: hypothetical protein HYX49_08960 [Chloroflexi bacterium]|nr:hypothetical protein [Chloroflexota bacterium]